METLSALRGRAGRLTAGQALEIDDDCVSLNATWGKKDDRTAESGLSGGFLQSAAHRHLLQASIAAPVSLPSSRDRESPNAKAANIQARGEPAAAGLTQKGGERLVKRHGKWKMTYLLLRRRQLTASRDGRLSS